MPMPKPSATHRANVRHARANMRALRARGSAAVVALTAVDATDI